MNKETIEANKFINKINLLHKETIEIQYFLKAITGNEKPEHEKAKIKIKKLYSIFGSRFFGCGTHKQEIEVPKSIIHIISESAEILLKQKQKELDTFLINSE